MPLHIYAEHLINIRTLTIQSTLPSPSNENTACTLSADGNILKLTHQGETASITLPVAVPAHASTSITIPTIPTKDLSFRVRLEYDDTLQDRQSSETIIPWTAASLSHTVELRCKNCRAVILPQGKIQTWKDLPSEGWAEMMEFWHCHKPNEPHNHEQQTDKKGYSAESKLAITPSVGLVNATSFILAAADCDNIKVGELFSLPFEHLGVHSGTEKNRRFSAARLLYMEDSGYCCPKANLFFAAWNLLQPLRKLWVLWRSNAPSCDLIVPSLSLWAWRTSAHRYIPKYSIKYTIMFSHSTSFQCMLTYPLLRCLSMLRTRMPTPTWNAPRAMPLSVS
jgi:hypothetical protein